MSDDLFTDDDVVSGCIALIGKGATPEQIADWDEEVRAVLAAVAPSIYERGRRDGEAVAPSAGYEQGYREGGIDALRQAADDLEQHIAIGVEAGWWPLSEVRVRQESVAWLRDRAQGGDDQ